MTRQKSPLVSLSATGRVGGHRRKVSALAAGPPATGPFYWNPTQAQPDVVLPSSYNEARVLAGLGAYGAYTVIESPTANDLVLLAAHVGKLSTASGTLWVEVSVDPAGGTAYAPIAVVSVPLFVSGSGAAPLHNRTFRLPPITISAGSSIAVRGYITAGDLRFNCYLSLSQPPQTWVTPWPNTYIAGTRAVAHFRVPPVPTWVTVPPGTGWTQLVAGIFIDTLITAAALDPTAFSGVLGSVLEIAVGAAAAEVVYTRIPFNSTYIFGASFGYQESGTKALVPAATRVAVRLFNTIANHRVAVYFEGLIP